MTLKKPFMTKPKITWKECRDFAIRTNPKWAEGRGGRENAIRNSNKFCELFGHSPKFDPHKITARMILEDQLEMKNTYGRKNGTLNRYKSAISGVLSYCMFMDLLDKNWKVPTFMTFDENEDGQERYAYKTEEVHAMIDFARNRLCNDDLADIIFFAALTGIRLGKILQLTNDRINLQYQSMIIYKPKNKRTAVRSLGIHDALVPMLTERMSRQEPWAYTFRDDWGGNNMKARQKTLSRQWWKCLTYIGKPVGKDSPWKFHGLRHTCGTLLAESGKHVIEIKQHLGQSSTRSCERYLHTRDDQAVARANSIDFANPNVALSAASARS
jgi:integrase